MAFGLAALVGMVCGLGDPLADHAVTVLAAVAAAAAGAITLRLLLRRLPAEPPAPQHPEEADPTAAPPPYPGRAVADRRSFLVWTGTAGAVGVLAAASGRALARRTPSDVASTSDIVLPAPTATLPGTPATPGVVEGLAVDGISPFITPNADFYRIDTAIALPRPGLDGWRLRVKGDVDTPFEVSYAELMAMPQVEAPVTIACVSNYVGGDLVGNAVWQGVPLGTLLERAGVQSSGEQIVGRSLDGFTVGFPTATALDGRTALVAVGMNGVALPREHGFPARLIVEGLYGYVSATKWLSTIELTGWDYDAYWIQLGLGEGGPHQDPVQDRRPPRPGKAPSRERFRWPGWPGRRTGHLAGGDPGRRRRLGRRRAGPRPLRRHLAPVGLPVGRHAGAAHAAGPGHRRHRRGADRATIAPPDPDGATGWHTRKVTVAG